MFPAPKKLGSSRLGASTFFASALPSESCGSNGLPLTPNSIRIFGRAKALHLINHPTLCSYVDVIRAKHERIILVQEYYPLTLKLCAEKYPSLMTSEKLITYLGNLLEALLYLNNFGTICCNISPETLLINSKGQIKLYGYGLYYMTEGGSAISFPIGTPKYLPPELLISKINNDSQPQQNTTSGDPSVDSWSIGIIFLEMFTGINLFEKENTSSTIMKLLDVSLENENILLPLLEMHGCSSKIESLNPDVRNFLEMCLTIDPELRPTPLELRDHNLFSLQDLSSGVEPLRPHFPTIDPSLCLVHISEYKNRLNLLQDSEDLIPDYPHESSLNGSQLHLKNSKIKRFQDLDHLAERSIKEVYYLWQLAGGNVEQELKKQKLIHTKPSILTLPSITINEGEIFGGGFQRQELLPASTISLPLHNLRKRLIHVPIQKYYPLITQGENGTDDLETNKLPLVIREKDVEYQFHRLVLFDRLLKAYPYKLDTIVREARKDIPPFNRALIWASLLRVDGAVAEIYEQIDKETPTTTDRQIEVDIPRCHQYDELLSSPQGHAKFTRILKAWIVSHPNLVYWQGLDSLCAPFLYLNFENEALAYACLSAFIKKYLHNFFLRDNSSVIHEYLAKFSHLIAFHEPHLFNHLHSIGFIPELYSIPWFLTMFTHVFPLHKIFLLWDTLLLGSSSLPLCVGVALLKQLKDRLLQFGFNECFLLFSDMPDINMEQVVHDAVDVFCSTPSSITYRQFDNVVHPKESSDFHDAYKELAMEGIPITQLKQELCGRISGADVLELMAQKRGSKIGRPKILLLDVRPNEEFIKGTLPGAVSFPSDLMLTPEDKMTPSSQTELSSIFKGKIIVVLGSSSNNKVVIKVAHAILCQGFPRVCFLHNGIEIFRASGHIVVP